VFYTVKNAKPGFKTVLADFCQHDSHTGLHNLPVTDLINAQNAFLVCRLWALWPIRRLWASLCAKAHTLCLFFVHDSKWQDKIKTEYMNLYILNSIQNGSNSFGYPQDTPD
jgi:hypothetical protein